MATDGTSQRASSVASSSDTSMIANAAIARKFNKKERTGGTIKMKKPAIKQTKPGNWKESEIIETKKAESPLSVSVTSPGPIVNELDERTAASFPTGRLMEDHPDYIQCKHCKRPVPKGVAESHTTICIKQKREKAKRKKEAKEAAQRAKDAKEKGTDKDGDMKVEDAVVAKANGEDGENLGEKPSSARKGVVKGAADEGTKKGKKRKLDGEGDKEPKKKKLKKDEPKIKVPKPKGPVDVEKQCGVPLPNGAQCARSLTCKSHSMGAKRAVPGRSLPYDMLLQAYQKKNQAKQQKAAIDANAPLQDDFDKDAGPVDSDEEKDTIMAAIARSRPQPVEQHVFVDTRRKYQYVRMKEMLSNALGGSRGGGLFSTSDHVNKGFFSGGDTASGGIFGSSTNTGSTESNNQFGEPTRRPSLIQQAIGGQQRAALAGQVPSSRKPSVSAISTQ
ncbi:hypothetical protein MMC16_001641 [Acarospora aff. strigata]|nr:hypothetical protein [Acarospora aff. strigata]